jgi:hypothetical protein
VILLYVILLNVFLLNVILLNVVQAQHHDIQQNGTEKVVES